MAGRSNGPVPWRWSDLETGLGPEVSFPQWCCPSWTPREHLCTFHCQSHCSSWESPSCLSCAHLTLLDGVVAPVQVLLLSLSGLQQARGGRHLNLSRLVSLSLSLFVPPFALSPQRSRKGGRAQLVLLPQARDGCRGVWCPNGCTVPHSSELLSQTQDG